MAALALPVAAISSHVVCGICPSATWISTDWPFLTRVHKGTRIPSILAPTQPLPIRVWIA